MGIDGLWNKLKGWPYIFKLVPFSSLKGYRVFIDASGLFFQYRATARKQVINGRDIIAQPFDEREADEIWIRSCFNIVTQFMLSGIIPVLVFDGKASSLKWECKKQRKEDKSSFRNEYNDIMTKSQNLRSIVTDKDDLDRARTCLNALTDMSKELSDMIKNFFMGIGVPILQCNEEAERLCAALVREGYGPASLCEDGDGLAQECNILLRHISDEEILVGNQYERSFEIVHLYDVLIICEVTMQQFREACVLAGCDYNRSTKIDGIAFGSALNKIKTYGSLDNMALYEDITKINHKECLSLFENKPARDMIEYGFIDPKPYSDATVQCMNMFKMESYINKIQIALSIFTDITPKQFIHRALVPFNPLFIVDDSNQYSTLEGITPKGLKEKGSSASRGRGRGGKGRGRGRGIVVSNPVLNHVSNHVSNTSFFIVD